MKRLSLLLIAATAAALTLTPVSSGAETPGDADIAAAVKTELVMDPTVMFQDVAVECNAGVVTLAGGVNNVTARERAERIATTVRGVRTVVNRLTVDPDVDKSAEMIESDVNNALIEDPATESYEVDVSADGTGRVTLTGNVDSWTERDLASQIAGSVEGVTDVTNNIVVHYDQTRTDLDIYGDVTERLEWDAHVDATSIEVDVSDAVVNLSGTVASAAERNRAVRKSWVVGVQEVNADGLETSDHLKKGWKRMAKPFVADDKNIQRAVEAAMIYDPRVNSFRIGVDVEHGVVTLTGKVDNLRARSAAYDNAMNTVGVLRVENNIGVETAMTLADEEVEQSLERALERNTFLDDNDIVVDVTAGNARLTGTVDTYFEKGQAEDITSRQLGVLSVSNDIHVDATEKVYLYDPYVDDWRPHNHWYTFRPRDPGLTDETIEDAIADQLWWSPFVDSDAVSVSVNNGVATLTGTVDDPAERQAAENNAFDGGAIWVRNELEVATR